MELDLHRQIIKRMNAKSAFKLTGNFVHIVASEDGAPCSSLLRYTPPHMYNNTCTNIHTSYLRCHKSKSSNTYMYIRILMHVLSVLVGSSQIWKRFISLMIPNFIFFEVGKYVLTVNPIEKKISNTSTTFFGRGGFFFDKSV